MCNHGVTYTMDYWIKGLIRQLMSLSREEWLARNLMKHHDTQGAIALETKEELIRELEKLLNKTLQTIEERNRWILDLDVTNTVLMSATKI